MQCSFLSLPTTLYPQVPTTSKYPLPATIDAFTLCYLLTRCFTRSNPLPQPSISSPTVSASSSSISQR